MPLFFNNTIKDTIIDHAPAGTIPTGWNPLQGLSRPNSLLDFLPACKAFIQDDLFCKMLHELQIKHPLLSIQVCNKGQAVRVAGYIGREVGDPKTTETPGEYHLINPGRDWMVDSKLWFIQSHCGNVSSPQCDELKLVALSEYSSDHQPERMVCLNKPVFSFVHLV
jgi:hypothetical protein